MNSCSLHCLHPSPRKALAMWIAESFLMWKNLNRKQELLKHVSTPSKSQRKMRKKWENAIALIFQAFLPGVGCAAESFWPFGAASTSNVQPAVDLVGTSGDGTGCGMATPGVGHVGCCWRIKEFNRNPYKSNFSSCRFCKICRLGYAGMLVASGSSYSRDLENSASF